MRNLWIFLFSLNVLFYVSGEGFAELEVIGTATYDPDGLGPGDPIGNYKLIFDADNNGTSLVWLDYTNGALPWQDQMDWASELKLGKLTYDLDPNYIVLWDQTYQKTWRLPETPDGDETVAGEGFEGDPDADGIYSYDWGWNLANSELGHLFYEELGNAGSKDTYGSDTISFGLENAGVFNNLIPDSSYWTQIERHVLDPNRWIFSTLDGKKTIEDPDVNHSAMVLHPALVHFDPFRLDEVWDNGHYLAGGGGSSLWMTNPFNADNGTIVAQDFILNSQTKLTHISLTAIHYTHDRPLAGTEFINFWFFEDNAGEVGNLIYQGSESYPTFEEVGIYNIGALREYLIELPDIPDMDFAQGHYWLAFQVAWQSPSIFYATTDGSDAAGDYSVLMSITNGNLAAGQPWTTNTYVPGFSFRLMAETEPGSRTFSFSGTVTEVIEGDAGLALGDPIDGLVIVSDVPGGSDTTGTTYPLKAAFLDIPSVPGGLMLDQFESSMLLGNDAAGSDNFDITASLSIDSTFEKHVGTVAILTQDLDATLFTDETMPVYAPPLSRIESKTIQLTFTADASFCTPTTGPDGTCQVLASLDTLELLPLSTDTDGDGITNNIDNCPGVANATQTDTDGDGTGNECDNCLSTFNADQANRDGDGLGDFCDNCDFTATWYLDQQDSDNDGFGDVCDNCLAIPNSDQNDANSNDVGDACDASDSDLDTMSDEYEYRLNLMANVHDGTNDYDGDGETNISEHGAGTNPVPLCGDLSDDTWVNLDDLIISLQIYTGMSTTVNIFGDCNSNDRIDMGETLSIAQNLSSGKCLDACQAVYDIDVGECTILYDDTSCSDDQTCIDETNAQKTTCINGAHASRNTCYETCN